MDKNDPRREPTEDELKDLNENWSEPDQLNEHVEEPGDPDGIIAAEEQQKWQAEKQREREATANQPLPKRYQKKHRLLKFLVVLVVLAAATYGAYWFGSRQGSTPAPKASKSTQSSTSKNTTPAATVATKHYDSTTYTLGFDYPETWKVTDTTSKLTVVSPSVQLTIPDGTKTPGHVLVTVQNQQTTIPGYPAGGATAALESQKLTYKQPTTIQRAQTYLSFLSYKKTNGLDAVYITGDSGYTQDQTIPMSDVVKGNPLVGVTFVTCATDDCTTGMVTPLTLLASSWKTASFNVQIINLLESIQLN